MQHVNHRASNRVNELAEAVKRLNASELYLDDNSPWRIMLTREGSHLAVAEQHPEAAFGDGEWQDGKAICDIVNAAMAFVHSR